MFHFSISSFLFFFLIFFSSFFFPLLYYSCFPFTFRTAIDGEIILDYWKFEKRESETERVMASLRCLLQFFIVFIFFGLVSAVPPNRNWRSNQKGSHMSSYRNKGHGRSSGNYFGGNRPQGDRTRGNEFLGSGSRGRGNGFQGNRPQGNRPQGRPQGRPLKKGYRIKNPIGKAPDYKKYGFIPLGYQYVTRVCFCSSYGYTHTS